MKKLLFSVGFLLFCFNILMGQNQLRELSDLSIKIIEAKVLSQETFKSQKDGHIYTRNVLEVLKVFKGNSEPQIEIITLGGTLENVTESWSHSFGLLPKSNGIFFLQNSLIFEGTFMVTNGNKGFIAFKNYTGQDLYGYGYKNIFKNLTKDLYDPLSEINGSPHILKLNQYESDLLATQISIGNTDCVEYTIKNLQVTETSNLQITSSYNIDFDIDIRSLNQIFQLRRSEITMEYSTSLLGQNIVSNNNIIASLGGDFQNYSITLSDAEPNKVKVNIEKILGQIANDVNTFQEKIYHATINIQNFDLSAILNLTVDENFDLKTFKEDSNNNEIEINCNQYNDDISITLGQLLPADITSYNQVVYAGTKTLLTIEGTNLLNLTGHTEIWFRNAEKGSIVSWVKPFLSEYKQPLSSNKIEVYVPSKAVDAIDGTEQDKEYAGSGTFRLVHKNNGVNSFEAEKDLTVVYAVRNVSDLIGGSTITQPVMLSNNFGNDGYIITFTQAFKEKHDNNGFFFKDAFESALNTWCSETKLNYVVDEDAINTGNYDFLIDYAIPNSSSALASTKIASYHDSNCSVSIDNGSINHPESHESDFIDNITIVINSTFNTSLWDANNLVPSSPSTANFSVEQVFLHELGHAHGILHTNHPQELMWWEANSSTIITSDASSASNYIQNHSANHLCGGGAYQKQNSCTTSAKELVQNIELNNWYSNGNLHIKSDKLNSFQTIRIYSVDGILLKSVEIDSQFEMILPFIPPSNGVYIISYFSSVGNLTKKLLIAE